MSELSDVNAAYPCCYYFRRLLHFHNSHYQLSVLFLAWEVLQTSESLMDYDKTDANL